MSDWIAQLQEFATLPKALGFARAALLLIGGFLLARVASRAVERLIRDRVEAGHRVLIRRLVFYSISGLFAIATLHELGFNLSVLLGAAGVLSVAIGFASQTSASNLVSGLFLIAERAFSIGDVIQVGSTTGEVLSIDLLSAKLRTFDNLYVRIPNETLVKSEVRTLTKFPIRRLDLQIGVAYREDIDRVHEVLLRIGERNQLCLDEPKPLFLVLGFGESSVNIQFSPWALKENFVELRNTIQREIKQAFEEHGIEIPYPHRAMIAASDGHPIAVQVVAATPSTQPTPSAQSNDPSASRGTDARSRHGESETLPSSAPPNEEPDDDSSR